jgi:hypothetical protein
MDVSGLRICRVPVGAIRSIALLVDPVVGVQGDLSRGVSCPSSGSSRQRVAEVGLPRVAERHCEAVEELAVLGLETRDLFVRAGQTGL